MALAFMLINCRDGAEDELLKELRKLDGVEEASRVEGVYDIIVKVGARTKQYLKEVSIRRIRELHKVRSTLTVVARDHA